MHRMTRRLVPAAAAIALGVPSLASAALPDFATTPARDGDAQQASLAGISVATHPAFDRVVFRFTGAPPRYLVQYVPSIRQDGSGFPVAVAGRRFIGVYLESIDTASGVRAPKVLTPRFPMLRQMKQSGNFEALLSYGLGLRTKRGFRVFRLSAPTRVVVDLRH